VRTHTIYLSLSKNLESVPNAPARCWRVWCGSHRTLVALDGIKVW